MGAAVTRTLRPAERERLDETLNILAGLLRACGITSFCLGQDLISYLADGPVDPHALESLAGLVESLGMNLWRAGMGTE